MNPDHVRKCWRFLIFLAFLGVNSLATAAPIIEQWEVIKDSFFPKVSIIDAAEQISIKAPQQAENAALVPFSFQVDLVYEPIKSIHLFTDANPILHTATFNLPKQQTQFSLSTRIRLEKNSIVRVIVESSSGKHLMKTVAIKTPGGGCGGGAMTNEAKLRAEAGRMKLKFSKQAQDNSQPFALLIKHPMRTGFERTFQGYYAKAWFMEKIEISQNEEPILKATLGPGISADPFLKFGYLIKNQSKISVKAIDNESKLFTLKNSE